ncbi:MAG: aspartyl/asparaginyl beta-hydroxylase domain-containing protein [Acidobacteria bacterium]|nr:aspartyl/asparaginyl beta-hydroxylase domain-containing protein [Acidobacteriota bacterium]
MNIYMHTSTVKSSEFDEQLNASIQKEALLNSVVFARMRLPQLDIEPFAQVVEKATSAPFGLGRKGYIYFDGDDWAGWRINGCGQKIQGEQILGYYMNPDLNYLHHFTEAEKLIEMMPGQIHAVRLFKLKAGAKVDLHKDGGEFYLERKWWEVRKIHIPIITNKGCRHSYLAKDGTVKSVAMKQGEAWYLNGTHLHGAENYGNNDRWHLVIDVDITDELYAMFR